jgi:hypothetical protein
MVSVRQLLVWSAFAAGALASAKNGDVDEITKVECGVCGMYSPSILWGKQEAYWCC